MIESLQIQNFQSHKDTKLKFTPGVNIIVGPSDSGKTAIIRAIRWVTFNRPLGDTMKSWWEGDTKVIIHADNCKVERFKSKKDHYLLEFRNPELKNLKFKAFGTEPPEEIKRALDLTELNVQNQMDSSFLLSENSGEVSRHFNRIANIDQIDSSLKTVEKWVRAIGQDLKAAKNEAERYEEELEQFSYLDKVEAEVEVLEGLESEKVQLISSSRNLENTVSKIKALNEELEENEQLLLAEEQVTNILQLFEDKKQVINECQQLISVSKQTAECFKEMKEYKALTSLEKPINLLLNLYNTKQDKKEEYQELVTLLNNVQNVIKKINKAHKHLNELEQTWHNEMPEICPLCGQGTL